MARGGRDVLQGSVCEPGVPGVGVGVALATMGARGGNVLPCCAHDLESVAQSMGPARGRRLNQEIVRVFEDGLLKGGAGPESAPQARILGRDPGTGLEAENFGIHD